MFYSVFVLGKKGPLARVWLAAHWDKKITKAQILETNIVESVDSILQPRIKLSLRTSSHLLLGVVRIYARKTLYLLQDCQDAAFKIKSAFRPGTVDLPDGKTEAAISAITLPEMLDFINDFDLIAEPPIQIDAPATNANIRNITLVEEVGIHVDDPLLNEVRDWSELNSVHEPGSTKSFDNTSLNGQQQQRNANPLDIFDRTPVDDGFGRPLDLNDVDDMFALPVPPEAREHINEIREEDEIPVEKERPISRLSDRSDSMSFGGPPSVAPSGPPSTPGSVPPPPEDEEMIDEGPPVQEADGFDLPPEGPEHPRDGDLPQKPDNQDTMVLEPLDGQGFERRRKRRKKLGIIIDEVKTLSGEEMKGQLSDTTDIVTSLDLAPPSKKLMLWKKIGGSEKLFGLPERSVPSKLLFTYYSRHLRTNRVEVEEEIPEELMNGDVPQMEQTDVHLQTEQLPPTELDDIIENLPPILSPDKEMPPPKTPKTPRRGETEKSPVKKKRKTDTEKEKRPKTPRAELHERISNHIIDDELDSLPEHRAGSGLYNSAIHPNETVSLSQDYIQPEMDEEEHTEYDQPMSVGPIEEMMPDETAEQYEERMRNKRTNVLLRFMAKRMEEEQRDKVTFSQCVINNRRKQVAQKFFSLLVLKKQQAIELTQDTNVSYGEILITRGNRFDEALVSSSL